MRCMESPPMPVGSGDYVHGFVAPEHGVHENGNVGTGRTRFPGDIPRRCSTGALYSHIIDRPWEKTWTSDGVLMEPKTRYLMQQQPLNPKSAISQDTASLANISPSSLDNDHDAVSPSKIPMEPVAAGTSEIASNLSPSNSAFSFNSDLSIDQSDITASSLRIHQQIVRQLPPILNATSWGQLDPWSGPQGLGLPEPQNIPEANHVSAKARRIWTTIVHQRNRIEKHQAAMLKLIPKLEILGLKLSQANMSIIETLKSAEEGRLLPRGYATHLTNEIQRLQSDHNSALARFAAMGDEMRRLVTGLKMLDAEYATECTKTSSVRVLASMIRSPIGISRQTARVGEIAPQDPSGTQSRPQFSQGQPGDLQQRNQKRQRSRDRSLDGGGNDSRPGQDLDHGGHPPTSDLLLGISGERPSDRGSPAYEHLLKMVAQRKLAEESLGEVEVQRQRIMDDLATKVLIQRHQNGEMASEEELQFFRSEPTPETLQQYSDLLHAHLPADDLEDLFNFNRNLEQAQRHLDMCQERVARMLQRCHELEAFPSYTSDGEEYDIFGPNYRQWDHNVEDAVMSNLPPPGVVDSGRLDHPLFPILLTSPKYVLQDPFPLTAKMALKKARSLPRSTPYRRRIIERATKEYGIETTLARAKNSTEYINRWLLQQLRLTPMLAEVLYSTFTMHLQVANPVQWQNDTLHHWSLDEANRQPEVEYVSSS